jgi:hypothetical protein
LLVLSKKGSSFSIALISFCVSNHSSSSLSAYLGELSKRELIYAAPGRELNWWRPTPEALLALGLRSIAEIPELKELENWFDSQKSYPRGHRRICSKT